MGVPKIDFGQGNAQIWASIANADRYSSNTGQRYFTNKSAVATEQVSESPGSRRSGTRYMKLLTGMARLVGATAAS